MRSIPLGAEGYFELRVCREHLANQFKDPLLPPVLSTPVMLMAMENAALNAIRPYLDPGESAVGVAVDIRHIAATPLGFAIHAAAEVVAIEGNRVLFKISATDGKDKIGGGTHQRVVIELRTFEERLAEKQRGSQP